MPELPVAPDGVNGVDAIDLALLSTMLAVDLSVAIVLLGGRLSPAQRRALDAVTEWWPDFDRPWPEPSDRAVDEPWHAPTPARRPRLPGRNQPCPCGSGRKYKKCHLEADRRGGRR